MSWIGARRYAKALMDIGVDRGTYRQYAGELATMQATMEKAPLLKATLLNRSVSNRSKRDLTRKVFAEEGLSEVVINFIALLVKHDRLQQLPLIIRHYGDLIDEHEGRVRVTVYSVYPLEAAEVSALKTSLEATLNKKSIVENNIDQSLIGGIVLKLNNMLIDSSIRSRLRRLGETLRKE
jgi:F-type H+-transporting ATPase subunit delta